MNPKKACGGSGVKSPRTWRNVPLEGLNVVGTSIRFWFADAFCFAVLSIAFGWFSGDAIAGTIAPELVLRNGDVTVSGDMIQSLAGEVVSISNNGDLAVLANVSGNGTGQALIAVDVADDGEVTLSKFSFANPSTNRTYLSPWRLDNGEIGARDQLSGSPPASLIRTWNAGTFLTLAASAPVGAYDFVTTPSFAKTSSYHSFTASEGGSVGLYIQLVGTADTRVTTLTGGGFRPMTANNGNTVIRTNNNADIRIYRPGAASILVNPSPTGIIDVGNSPGITDDGEVVAFSGEANGTAGIFAYIDGVTQRLAAPSQADAFVDPFEVWQDSNGNRSVEAGEISGGISGFNGNFSRIGIKEIDRPLGEQLLVTFVGTGNDGNTGVYYARVDRDSGRIFGTARIARAGTDIDGLTPTTFTLFDPINVHGEIAFQASDGISSGAFIHAATLFTKYKQGGPNVRRDGMTAIASNSDTRWFDKPVNPNLPVAQQKSMSQVGCTLTALATIAGVYGKEVTPLEMRDHFLNLPGPPAIRGNDTYVSRFELTVGATTLRRSSNLGGTFTDIGAELRTGNPVLLAVPNRGSTGVALGSGMELTLANGNLRANDRRHYIVAYGLNPILEAGDPITPDDIFISDPAYSRQYADSYGGAYSAGEELVNVTLQDYFDIINNNATYSFDAEAWFNSSTFTRLADGRTVQVRGPGDVGGNDRPRQIQRFTISTGVLPPNPMIDVESPVELRITIGGVIYASSDRIAQPGDVLLLRSGSDIVAEFDEVTGVGTGENEPVDLFPPYTLFLPPETAGLNLDFEIHGVSDGEYRITLVPGMAGYFATNFLEGTIMEGVIANGSIGVSVPEPSSILLVAVGMVVCVCRRRTL